MKNEKQSQARDLFMHAGKTQTEIADILDVNRKTIYLWIKNGKWEEMRHAAAQAPGIIIQDIYNHIGAVNRKISSHDDGCPEPKEVEMLRKLLKMTSDINKNHVGSYIEAFTEISTYMLHRDIPTGRKFVEHADDFIRGKFGDGSWEFKITDRTRQNVADVEHNLKKQEEQNLELETDLYTEPNARSAAHAADDHLQIDTCKLPAENYPIAQKMGKNGAFSKHVENTSNSAAVKHFSQNSPQTKCPISAIKEYIRNGTFEYSDNPRPPLVAAEPYSGIGKIAPKETWKILPVDGNGIPVLNAVYYATLLPGFRPSPFREGNIIWVNTRKDITDDIAKHLKMGDTIRYYPGMDPNEKATNS